MDKILSAKDLLKPNEAASQEESYIPLDMAAAANEHGQYVQGGESCRIDALKDVFAWMRGTINGWYGWASDGKSEMRDYLKIIKAKRDDWKFACFRPEDMDSAIIDGKIKIRANRLYKNLAWTLTGKTWNKSFAEKHRTQAMTFKEEMEALEFITSKIFVIYPRDRKYKKILDEFKYLKDKYGIDGFEIDPISGLILPNDMRGDEMLASVYFDMKEFALETNSVLDIVNHPKSMNEVKNKDGRYKVVNQFMVIGGGMNDAKLDGQYSIYRPERHIDPKDPKVHFWNLKQKNSQLVGVQRGSYENIEFSYVKKQYYFDGVNPMDGTMKQSNFNQQGSVFNPATDDAPF